MRDREWMVVRKPVSDDALADMVSMSDLPRMATIQPFFTSQGKLALWTNDGKSIVVEAVQTGVHYKSRVWHTDVTGMDQGDDVATFLTSFLDCHDKPVRLIRMSTPERKLAECAKYSPTVVNDADHGGVARFSNFSQLSLISNQTISWVNAAENVSGGLTNARFRMNIVVDAAGPFAEDRWQTFSIRNVEFRLLKRCGRCEVILVDPVAGSEASDLEPLKTLQRLRSGDYPFLEAGKDPQAFLGIDVRHFYKPGQQICVGDSITVKQRLGSWFT